MKTILRHKHFIYAEDLEQWVNITLQSSQIISITDSASNPLSATGHLWTVWYIDTLN